MAAAAAGLGVRCRCWCGRLCACAARGTTVGACSVYCVVMMLSTATSGRPVSRRTSLSCHTPSTSPRGREELLPGLHVTAPEFHEL